MPEALTTKEFKKNKNIYSIKTVLTILSIAIVAFAVLQFIQFREQEYVRRQEAVIVREEQLKQQELLSELYSQDQYQITDYKIGACPSREPSSCIQVFEHKPLNPCEANVSISTIVSDNIDIDVTAQLRILDEDNNFVSYYTELQDDNNRKAVVYNTSASVEKREEEKTLFIPRPENWFCLPSGNYQEQVTIKYTYCNEAGCIDKSPVYISEPFTII